MDHYYEFFDKAASEQIWVLRWSEYLSRFPNKWSNQKHYSPGEYDERDGLRGLLAFCLDPEPSAEDIEHVLQTKTVRWTVSRVRPPHYFMGELMRQTPATRQNIRGFSTKASPEILLACAVDAYLRDDISAAQLRSVVKLHWTDVEDWLQLTAGDRERVRAALRSALPCRSIFSWQKTSGCEDEEWANVLGVTETARFLEFLEDAYSNNWPAPRLRTGPAGLRRESKIPRIRDSFLSDAVIRPALRWAPKLSEPCVYRTWE